MRTDPRRRRSPPDCLDKEILLSPLRLLWQMQFLPSNIPPGAVKRPMPQSIYPCWRHRSTALLTARRWLFEIKWDGYRAVCFIENGKLRLTSRNQNDLTGRYPELKDLPRFAKGQNMILDGEVVALVSRAALLRLDAAAHRLSSWRAPSIPTRMCPSFITPLISSIWTATTCERCRSKRASELWPQSWDRRCAALLDIRGAGNSTVRDGAPEGIEGIVAKNATALIDPR